jgi:hypothetical protein
MWVGSHFGSGLTLLQTPWDLLMKGFPLKAAIGQNILK